MSKFLSIVRDTRAKLAEERAALLAEADTIAESRDAFDDTAAVRADEIIARLRAINDEDAAAADREAELVRASERADAAAKAPTFIKQVDTKDLDVRSMNAGEIRDAALKTLETQRSVNLSDKQLEQVDRLIRARSGNTDGAKIAERLLITERPEYRSAFVKVFHALGMEPGLTDGERRALAEFRAASLTDANGGYGVPVLIDPTIILTSQGSSNAVYNAARKVTITNDEWKGVSSAGVSWSWDAEAGTVSDDAPTLGQPSVSVHKAQGFIPYSIEIGQDYPNFAAEMSRLLVEGYNELLAEALINGTGSGQPFGIAKALNATTSEVLPVTDGEFNKQDVYAIWDALPERFKGNASWLMSTDVQNHIRQFGSNDPEFTVNLTAGGIPQLFGRPVMISEYMADFTGTTGQSDYLIVGDFGSGYLVAQRAGMNVELVPMLFDVTYNRPTGQRGWYAWARVGADSIVDNAFRMLANT